jgi:hypothetical protein
MNITKLTKLCLLAGAIPACGLAFAPTNFYPPYDPAILFPEMHKKDPLRIGFNTEYGATKTGRNWDGKKRNVLQLHDDTQSALAMLRDPATPAMQTAVTQWELANFGRRIDEAGTRGRLSFTGKFEQWDISPLMRYQFPVDLPGKLAINASLPVRYARLYNTNLTDLTPSRDADDITVQTYLSNPTALKAVAQQLGGFTIGNWSKTGLGDLAVWLDWNKDFPQEKEALESVTLSALLGVTCPTGEKRDVNQAFSVPFGEDGAWGMPVSIGLDLDFKYHIRLGLEAEFYVVFDNTSTRRMMTFDDQTEFLLLEKGRASCDHGLEWKFFLYLQGYRFWKGLSLRFAYEYIKHDNDTLTPKSEYFSTTIVNTANELREWNEHQLIFSLNYDFVDSTWGIKPQFSVFYKLPVYGKNILNPETVGGQFALNF